MCSYYELGSLGILILQIPVVGGYRGGEFRVKTETSLSETFAAHQNSTRSFHVTVFYDGSEIVMSPVTNGSRIILVYNLRRTTSIIGVTPNLYEDSNSHVYRIRQLPRPPLTAEDNFSKKQYELRDLFLTWSKRPRNNLFAIPLNYTYSKKDLCFATLKGSDRLIAEFVFKLLGDFVEVHLAIVTKYMGYKEEDWNAREKWATSGSDIMNRKTNDNDLEDLFEKDWIQYLASNWSDADNHQLVLPPLPICVPDQLLKFDDLLFTSSAPLTGGMFCGLSFDRASIILWPRDKTFDTSLLFGLDQALDVAENGFEMDPGNILEGRKKRMEMLLAFCKKEPSRCWFASSSECSDLRCDRARPVSPQVATKRALRLIDLCINWKLPEFGKELLRRLFSKFERTDYRCDNCFKAGQRSLFVGGICSNEVANKLADFFAFLDLQQEAKDVIKLAIKSINQFDFKQTGHLAYLATHLFHRQWQELATFVCDEAYSLLTLVYLEDLTETQAEDGVVGSCLKMLHLIDGPPSSEECRLSQLLLQLDGLSNQNLSLIICWFQNTDPAILKSLPSYWEFYMKLVDKLECHLIDAPRSCASPLKLKELSALLFSTYFKLEDDEKLQSLVNRIISSSKAESRLLLAATISSQHSWSSPTTKSTLVVLTVARVQQLVRFTFPFFKWEQLDAVFNGHPIVEAFLHSARESMVYSEFKNREEALDFASNFDRQNVGMGYSAFVSEIIPAADDEMVSVRITKTPEIYELSRKQLEVLNNFLSTQQEETKEAIPTLHAQENTSNGAQSTGSKTPSAKRPRKEPTKKKTPATHEKRSKRMSTLTFKADSEETSTRSNSLVSEESHEDEVGTAPTE